VLGLAFGLALDFGTYVKQSAEAPWTTGIWATFMPIFDSEREELRDFED
jgi:hypothetical protein